MGVNEIEKLLKQIVKDYEMQYTSAENIVKEHEEDWKDQFFYAECLNEPVNASQILFWNENSGTVDGRVRELFEYIHQYYGNQYTYIWVVKYKKEKPKEPLEGVSYVKKNSKEYWKALAQSGYLMGEGILPAAFVKRNEQIYVNLTGQMKETGIDEQSLMKKEYRKTDFFPELEEKMDVLAKRVLEKCPEKPVKSSKQKVLFLTNWKEEREHRYFLQQLLSLADNEKYDLTVMTPRLGNPFLEREFESLSDKMETYIYRGRMTVTRKEFLLLHILEKNPVLYYRIPQIRKFIDGLVKREWTRIWGKSDFETVVLAGNASALRYFLACGSGAQKKILLDLGFIEKVQRKYISQAEEICAVFDCIYAFSDIETQMRTEHLPVVFDDAMTVPEKAEIANLDGVDYLVCDRWASDENRTRFRLVEYPLQGSCLVNAMLPPDLKRETYLKEKLKGRKVYLVGKESKAYKGFLPGSTVLDSYVLHFLPNLLAGRWFFGQFYAYYGDERLEYDRLEKVCLHFKVKFER